MFTEIKNDIKFVFKTLVNNLQIFFIILFLQFFLEIIVSEHFSLGYLLNRENNLGSMFLYIFKSLLVPNIILIVLYSGVLELSKKIINKEKVTFKTCIIGVKKYWIKITFLIIASNIAYWVISILVVDQVPIVIGKYIILDTISFFKIFLVLYIVFIIINSEATIIFVDLKKFFFSSKFVQSIILITMSNLIFIAPIRLLEEYYVNKYFRHSSPLSLLNLMGTGPIYPIWLDYAVAICQAIIISFIFIYASLQYYRKHLLLEIDEN